MLDGIEFLTSTVETGSFAAAARRLGVTPSAVSRRVAALERELGVTLLARTTRSLRLTEDGRVFHERCVRILHELDDARDLMSRAGKSPSGLLRVDAPIALGRVVVAPSLPPFLDRHPEVRVHLTLRDQLVDPVVEGADVLVRIGTLADSSLVARRLGASRIVHCASPAYVEKRGMPKTPRDLARHDCIGYLRDGIPDTFKFVSGTTTKAAEIRGPAHANDAEVLRVLAVAGKGIVALFDFLVAPDLASGALVRVLEDHPSTTWPIHALYAANRHLVPRVSVFLDHLTQVFAAAGLTAPRPHAKLTNARRGRRRAR